MLLSPLFRGDTQVKNVPKHLGLIISSDFSWNDQMEQTQAKLPND